MKRRSLCSAVLLVMIFAPQPRLRAQPAFAAGTVGAALAAAHSVLDQLNNILVSITGDASIAVGGATTQFSQLSNQVQAMVQNDLTQPINTLTGTVQVSMNTLVQTTAVLSTLVSKQRDCIFQRLDLFVAGLQTAISGIKVLGLPIISNAPRLVSFKFDGQVTPDILPKGGGTAPVSGVAIWTTLAIPPTVQLRAADAKTVLGTLTPQRGDSNDDFRVPISASLFANLGGQCLYFDVVSYKEKKILGIFNGGKEETGEATLPMCVPQEFDQSISMLANVSYSVTGNAPQRALSGKRFGFDNSSCEDRKNVTQTMGWDSEVPPGWHIISVQQSSSDIVNQTSIGLAFTGTSVTAAGWLDTASCIKTPFSATKLHDTHWNMTLTPIVDGPQTTTIQSTSSAQPIAMNYPTTSNLCTNPSMQSGASGASTVWITLNRYFRGEQQSVPMYIGPRMNDPSTNQIVFPADTDATGAYQITLSYNPAVVNGTCQVCASITSTGSCAW